MSREYFANIIHRLKESKCDAEKADPKIDHFILEAFNDLAVNDRICILCAGARMLILENPEIAKHSPITEIQHNTPTLPVEPTVVTSPVDVIQQANDIELIKLKSFLIKSITVTFLGALIIAIFLVLYFINSGNDSTASEYFDELIKIWKLIFLGSTK